MDEIGTLFAEGLAFIGPARALITSEDGRIQPILFLGKTTVFIPEFGAGSNRLRYRDGKRLQARNDSQPLQREQCSTTT